MPKPQVTTEAALDMYALRRQGGAYLRDLREARGLTQKRLADLVNLKYHRIISLIEIGRNRIPPDCYLLWAASLDIDPKLFVRKVMRYYDPITYEILFEGDAAPEAELTVSESSVGVASIAPERRRISARAAARVSTPAG